MADPLIGLLSAIDEYVLAQEERWTWLRKAEGPVGPDYAVVFAPKHWRETFPAVGTRPKFDPHHWIIFALEVLRDRCLLRISVYTTSDQPLRQRVISRLVENPEEFGFKMFRKAGMTAKRTTLLAETFIDWREGHEPTPVQAATAARMKLDEIWTRCASIPDTLQPIFDARRNARANG